MARSNLLLRVLTALALIPAVLALVLYAPRELFAAVVALLAVGTLREYLGMAAKSDLQPLRVYTYLAIVGVIAWPMLGVGGLALLALAALVVTMAPGRPLQTALCGAASSIFGVMYIGLPLAMLVQLRTEPRGRQWVIYVLVLVWVSDTAAYFAGRFLGRHKLAPRISPGKTWEGALGSVAGAVIFGLLYMAWFMPMVSIPWRVMISVLVNVAGQLGDLAESALKRGAGVKDSGALLPGHGGLLDRIDALLFAVPALWYILFLRTSRFFAPLP